MKKWILRILGVILVLIIGLVVYIEVNKEKLVALAIDEANKSINGTITYEDTDISLFTSFPNLEISLMGMKVHDATMKEDIPLLDLGVASTSVNLMSALKKEVVVNGFSLEDGTIYLANYIDGSNNYSITKETSSEGGSAGVDFDIEGYTFRNINVTYIDQASRSKYEVKDFNTDGRLSYKSEFISLENNFNADILVNIADLLPSYAMAIEGQMGNSINPAMDKITIDDASFRLNDLPIGLDGEVNLGEYIDYKFDFNSPSTEIKRLLSILPNFYKNQYESLIGKGTYVLSGNVDGSTKDDFPIYKFSLMAKDGSLSYPDLNAQIDKFGFSLVAENESTSSMYSRLIINDIDIASGTNVLQGSFASHPEGARHKVTTDLVADIKLEELAKSLVLQETKMQGSVKGLLKANASINTTNNDVRASDERFEADIAITDVIYKDKSLSLALNNGSIKGNKEKLDIDIQQLQYQDELDMNIKGVLNDPIQIALNPDHVIDGAMEINAGTINLDKLSEGSAQGETTVSMAIPKTNVNYVFQAKQIIRGVYTINDIRANGTLKNIGSNVDFTIGEFNGSNIHGNGTLDNILAYGMNNDTLTGKLNIVSDRLDLNKFMGLDEQDQLVEVETTEPLIPTNIDLDINYEASQIGFKNIDISKSLGEISIKDQKVIFENKGDIFGGKVGLSGVFDTDLPEGYQLEMKLELKELQFSETAANLALFNQLLPIAKLLEGKYTASLSWSSKLSKDYMPDMNSLTAYGLIETVGSGIKSSLPLDSLIRKLKIIGNDKQPLKIQDVKNYFIIEDGKVLVKEIALAKDDIDITMSGSHSFSQALDYKMLIDIPKSKLKVDGVLNFIQDKLKFSNILSNAGNDVDVQVEAHMGGSILKPTFSIKGINLKQGDVVESIETQISNKVNEVKDSIQNVVKDTISGYINKGKDALDSLKTKTDEIKKDVKEKIDSSKQIIKDEINKEKEELKKEGTDILTGILTGNSDSTATKIDDIFKDRQGKLDSLAKKFPINLLGRKKSN